MIKKALVSVEWLKNNLLKPELIILDSSLKKDKFGQNVKMKKTCIPGALFFNISETFSDQESTYPNMLPSNKDFEREAQNLGVNNTSIIVVYDSKGLYSSARAWWMFKLMGHSNVFVLDGGLPEWERHQYPLSTINTSIKKGNFRVKRQPNMVWDYDQIKNNLTRKTHLIIDARSPDRFLGLSPEPRPQTKSGHIPFSLNLHYQSLIKDGKLSTKQEILNTFTSLGISDKPIVFSCGSGVTACILYLSAFMYLNNEIAVYDGSWTEWGEKIQ